MKKHLFAFLFLALFFVCSANAELYRITIVPNYRGKIFEKNVGALEKPATEKLKEFKSDLNIIPSYLTSTFTLDTQCGGEIKNESFNNGTYEIKIESTDFSVKKLSEDIYKLKLKRGVKLIYIVDGKKIESNDDMASFDISAEVSLDEPTIVYSRERVCNVYNATPIIGDIPFVGRMFKTRGESRQIIKVCVLIEKIEN